MEAPKLARTAYPCGLIFLPESGCFHGYSCRWLVSRIMLSAAQNLPEDPALLKAIIADLQAENAKLAATVRAHDLVVQALRLRIAKLKKQAFGKSSEKNRTRDRAAGIGARGHSGRRGTNRRFAE